MVLILTLVVERYCLFNTYSTSARYPPYGSKYARIFDPRHLSVSRSEQQTVISKAKDKYFAPNERLLVFNILLIRAVFKIVENHCDIPFRRDNSITLQVKTNRASEKVWWITSIWTVTYMGNTLSGLVLFNHVIVYVRDSKFWLQPAAFRPKL